MKTEKSNIIKTILTIVITAIITAMTIVILVLAYEPEYEDTATADTNDNDVYLEILDPKSMLGDKVNQDFILDKFMPMVAQSFEYEAFEITYNQNTFTHVVILTVTNESFGKYNAQFLETDDRDVLSADIHEELMESSELLQKEIGGNLTIELTTPELPRGAFMRLENSEVTFDYLDYFIY